MYDTMSRDPLDDEKSEPDRISQDAPDGRPDGPPEDIIVRSLKHQLKDRVMCVTDLRRQIAEKDARIAELEAKVAEAWDVLNKIHETGSVNERKQIWTAYRILDSLMQELTPLQEGG
jgi:uncharacterized coiled-coil protein SlyX